MVTPRRSKSGSIITRKGILKDARADYQRLYGPGWEAKLTVPPGTPPAEAKVRISESAAEIEGRIGRSVPPRRAKGSR